MVEAQWHSRQPLAGLLMTASVSGDGIGWSSVAELKGPAATVRA